MPCWTKLATFDESGDNVNVIIETPKGSRNKFNYQPEDRILKLTSILPAGAVFPFDFGFIPSTLGEDGDPLDILVIAEAAVPAGCLVPARVIGVLEAEQTEDGTTERNDRLIAVSNEAHCQQEIKSLDDMPKEVQKEIERFFISYNEMHGKEFKPLGIKGPNRALKLIKEGEHRFHKQERKKASKART